MADGGTINPLRASNVIAPVYSATPLTLPAGWTYLNQYKIVHTIVTADQSNLLLPFKISDTSIGAHALSTGADLRVLDANFNQLSFYMHYFYTASGTAHSSLEILFPTFSSTVDTTFYVIYGNASATAVSTTSVFGSNDLSKV